MMARIMNRMGRIPRRAPNIHPERPSGAAFFIDHAQPVWWIGGDHAYR